MSLFYNLGRELGRKAVPAIRKSKWVWQGLSGGDDEALSAEVQLGASMASEIRASSEVIADTLLVGELNELSRRVSEHLRDKRRTFDCAVLHDPAPNAIALPGGFLFFSDSLLDFCNRQQDELAFVVAHEVAHVALKHAWDRMLNESVLRVAAAATSTLGGAVAAWFRQRGFALLTSAHAHEREFSADELGVRLAAAAGFTPAGALTLLQRVHHSAAQKPLGQYFGTHPSATERLVRLRPIVQKLTDAVGGAA